MKKNKITSLYIHIPFCTAICNYCDFPKLQYFRNFAIKYLEALEKELNQVVDNKDLKTIYVGGGTPTSLEDDLFLKLLEMIEPFSKKVEEYTFEANPESLSINKLEMMKKYHVSRISLGVESTDDNILKMLNRKHTFIDVINAVNNIKKVGIDNYNLDLILGLPHVSKDLLKKDLENILSLSPQHISTYSLTVHPNTVFYLNKIKEPEDDFSRELYDYINDELVKHDYIHYEVSNFAKKGYESKHNFVYWKNEQYYGVGLAAAGYIDNYRYKNTDNFDKYIKGINEKEVEELSLKDVEEYQIMLNLRTNIGIDLSLFKDIFNKDLYITRKEIIDNYISQNYLFIRDNHLIASHAGMMILDRIILDLI